MTMNIEICVDEDEVFLWASQYMLRPGHADGSIIVRDGKHYEAISSNKTVLPSGTVVTRTILRRRTAGAGKWNHDATPADLLRKKITELEEMVESKQSSARPVVNISLDEAQGTGAGVHVADQIEHYLRQLAPHAAQREAAALLRSAMEALRSSNAVNLPIRAANGRDFAGRIYSKGCGLFVEFDESIELSQFMKMFGPTISFSISEGSSFSFQESTIKRAQLFSFALPAKL